MAPICLTLPLWRACRLKAGTLAQLLCIFGPLFGAHRNQSSPVFGPLASLLRPQSTLRHHGLRLSARSLRWNSPLPFPSVPLSAAHPTYLSDRVHQSNKEQALAGRINGQPYKALVPGTN
ncbi:hypothetical protein DFH07DRAFT_770671 [Mycena maculata]|uniref:Uncharacterized protein n=1 Tax=Mycena maculata TaxID=230809 RepID=A0AAD7JGL3_9AGAR|nr:hypothetical protein DFH07DRAFT_770671 [Mycena maculata]